MAEEKRNLVCDLMPLEWAFIQVNFIRVGWEFICIHDEHVYIVQHQGIRRIFCKLFHYSVRGWDR